MAPQVTYSAYSIPNKTKKLIPARIHPRDVTDFCSSTRAYPEKRERDHVQNAVLL